MTINRGTTHRPVPRLRTECPRCHGEGGLALPRAAACRGTGVRAYELRICPLCFGLEWLAGIVTPA
jgi:DnaJ-class molecular chaperone